MISSELKAAREYEEREGAKVPACERPVFHLSPRIGWLNDPNGFSYYGGKYHLFYQYHPYSTFWGPMHWGHAVSDDLIKWEYLPAAMAPDTEYDGAGCFSGSAVTLSDGRQLLMYTGCDPENRDPDGKWRQTQCIAVSDRAAGSDDANDDGQIEYIKYEGNPVLTGADLPSGGDPYEFRDPYVWRTEDGSYRSIIASANKDENKATQLCLYSSPDGFEWKFDKVLFEDWRHVGLMWECPNFFAMDDRHILVASPMDMEEEDAEGSIRFPKGNNVIYMVGDFDPDNEIFTPHQSAGNEKTESDTVASYHPVDCGLDFYAPQVTETADGRHVMIGWMQDPSMANLHEEEGYSIFCQMTVPRELMLRNDRLLQWPVRELEAYRTGRVRLASIETGPDERSIDELYGRTLDITLELKPVETAPDDEEDACSYSSFSMKFAADDEHCCELIYDPQRSILTVDRSRSGQSGEITKRRSIRVRKRSGSLDLRVLLDRWSAEIFINGGEQVMSVTYHTPLDADGISFRSEGRAALDITAHKISADA